MRDVSDRSSSSLGALIVWTLSIVVVCLAAFNFYLLGWLWCSLSGAAGRKGSLNLVSSWGSIQLDGKLATSAQDASLQVASIGARHQDLLIGSKSSIRVGAAPSLELGAGERRISLPRGLRLRSLNASEPAALECRPGDSSCLVKAKNVRFSHLAGLSLDRKSLQASRLFAGRLHSATNELSLLATSGACSFESRSLELSALDEVALLARTSHVILNAKSVDVSAVGWERAKQQRTKSRRGYRLCVCLVAELGRRPKEEPERRRRTREDWAGLVFAVRAQLSCARFAAFCQQQQQQATAGDNERLAANESRPARAEHQ